MAIVPFLMGGTALTRPASATFVSAMEREGCVSIRQFAVIGRKQMIEHDESDD
jgi:hypothetical protein